MTRRIAGRYLLGEPLGVGGSSRVFAALDERLGRQVAVKLLDTDLAATADPAGRERFLREGPTSASFQHRNAVTVFDAGEDDGDLYIVMELVDGPSLAVHMVLTGALSIGESTRIAGQVLAALGAAHAIGIVHRDVKPANVLIGADGDIKLADFGIAKRFDDLDDSVTRVGTVIGTLRYLAPEQAAGLPVTPATDIYAVGVLLYEMLTGRTPFADESRSTVMVAKQSRPAPDVRALCPTVSPRLAATIARALATDPADRYPTASAMAADLANSWSPPDGSLPEMLVQTTVMGAVPLPMEGMRSGDTEIWTQPADDDSVDDAATALAPAAEAPVVFDPVLAAPFLAAPVLAAPVVLDPVLEVPVVAEPVAAEPVRSAHVKAAPKPTKPIPSEPRHSGTRLRPVTLGLMLLVVLGAALIGLALRKDSIITPGTTAPATTPVDEIIPGFPRTGDLHEFLQQLEQDPTLVGSAGPALVDTLGQVLAEQSARQQYDRAKELRKELSKWVDAGELDPLIADALDALLQPMSSGKPPK